MKFLKIISAVNLVGLVIVLGLVLRSQSLNLGAQSNFSGPLNSLAGFQESGTSIVDTNGAWVNTVSSTGAVSLGGAVTFTSAGTVTLNGEVSLGSGNCSTATWNPGAVGSSTQATTTIAMPAGYTSTDSSILSFSATTSAADAGSFLILSKAASGTDLIAILSGTGILTGASTINPATGTLTACYLD